MTGIDAADNIFGMRRFLPIVACLLIAAWLTPAAGALAVGLHLELHHDGDHEMAPAVLEALAHGHRHSAEVPDHEHPAATEDASGPLPLPFATIAPTFIDVATEARRPAAPGWRLRGPPRALFYSHCSLLL